MTTDLWYLALTAMLTAALWIPYIVSQVMTNGFLQPHNYVDPTPRPVPLWGQRAHRVYLNAVEVFAPFAVLVLITYLAGKENTVTAFLTMSFFWIRLAHALVYFAGTAFIRIRTILFTLGFFVVLGLFIELLM
jgi:uncharacterized MAPEG superfamily protein